MGKKLKLEGLDCASCAYEIEGALKKEGFESASINTVTSELYVNGDIERAREIVKRVRPEVKFGDKEDKREENEKQVLYFLIPSFALFVIGIILRYYYSLNNIFIFSLFTISYVLVGWKVLKSAVINSTHGNIFDENFLMMVATIGAFVIGAYPEAVGVMLFYTVGEFFQDMAVINSKRSIKSLLALKAEYANLKKGEKIVKVKPEILKVGDIILIKPGERVPVDGIIIEGSSNLDTSALTGESVPKRLHEGEEIFSGMVNMNKLLTVKVTKELRESTISRILELVENASARKAKTEKFITKFAHYYTPAVVSLAVLVAAVPPIAFGEPFSTWIYRALILLVISCPCALVLSIPLGYFGGIGRAAKDGILVKGANFMDTLKDATVVAFDKTGTLTKGVFKVMKIEKKNGFSEEEIIKFAALAEGYSNHPIANAIKAAYGKEVNEAKILEYEEIAGYGVRAKLSDVEVLVGNDRILHRFNIEHNTCSVKGTVAHVVVNGKYTGYMVISDEIKEDASKAVKELKRLGVKNVVMVTGDNKDVAGEIAKELDIDTFYAELLPEDKVKVIENLEKKKKAHEKIVFVGDGINDAPVLARADVGVAMGALGSDAAVETADIVIMDDKPSKLPKGIHIAQRTRWIVWENIIFALGVKLVFISFGIVGEVTMWEAVFADVGVALIAVFNAMRILR